MRIVVLHDTYVCTTILFSASSPTYILYIGTYIIVHLYDDDYGYINCIVVQCSIPPIQQHTYPLAILETRIFFLRRKQFWSIHSYICMSFYRNILLTTHKYTKQLFQTLEYVNGNKNNKFLVCSQQHICYMPRVCVFAGSNVAIYVYMGFRRSARIIF